MRDRISRKRDEQQPERDKQARPSWPLPKAEPAVGRGITVALALLASLGFTWAADVSADTIMVVAIVLPPLAALAQGLWTRYAVTANAKVVARVTTEGAVVAGEAAQQLTDTELPVARPGRGDMPLGVEVAVRPDLVGDPPY